VQLTPRYGDHPILRIDLGGDDPADPMLRQRRRLADLLAGLDQDQWAAPSRCEGWSVRDVISHLVSTNPFWAFSIAAGLGGEPTRFLATFDPVASPAQLVEASRAEPASAVLAQFVATNVALAAAVDQIGDRWSTLAEAPPGHVPLTGVVLHALWDSWVHERDIALPLGLDTAEEPDELVGSLAYAAALSPAFAASLGSGREGTVAVIATDPDVRLVVEVGESVLVRTGRAQDDAPEGALALTGTAVDLIEGLSLRAPLPCAVPDDHRWLLTGLAEVFDQTA
jgi:uncharacterized protein (TIGR03083 family)